MTSLNPVLTVGRQIGEVLRRHQGMRGADRAPARAVELLDLVGIPLPAAAAATSTRTSSPAACGSG